MRNSEVFELARSAIDNTKARMKSGSQSYFVFGLQDISQDLTDHANDIAKLIEGGNEDFFPHSAQFLNFVAKAIEAIIVEMD